MRFARSQAHTRTHTCAWARRTACSSNSKAAVNGCKATINGRKAAINGGGAAIFGSRLTWLLRDCDAEVLDERRHPLSSQVPRSFRLVKRCWSNAAGQTLLVKRGA
eukprot:280779-Rhodomonas_salina.1